MLLSRRYCQDALQRYTLLKCRSRSLAGQGQSSGLQKDERLPAICRAKGHCQGFKRRPHVGLKLAARQLETAASI